MDQSPPGFKFHELKRVPFEKICRYISLKDALNLSFVSPHIKNALCRAKVLVDSLEVAFDSEHPTIKVFSGQRELIWNLFSTERRYPRDTIKMGRFEFECRVAENTLYTENYDVEHSMIAVLKNLGSIFEWRNAKINLSVDLKTIVDPRVVCEHFLGFTNLKRLEIYKSTEDELNVPSIDWIFNNLEFSSIYLGVNITDFRTAMNKDTKEFEIQFYPKRLEQVLSKDHIVLEYSGWITREDLLNLDVKTAIFSRSNLTEGDIVAFVKKWIVSPVSHKFMWMEIVFENRVLCDDDIIEELDVRESQYILQNKQCSCPHRRLLSKDPEPFIFPLDSRDITHSDGHTIATISFPRHGFFFHVKNEGKITAPTIRRRPQGAVDEDEEEEENVAARRQQLEKNRELFYNMSEVSRQREDNMSKISACEQELFAIDERLEKMLGLENGEKRSELIARSRVLSSQLAILDKTKKDLDRSYASLSRMMHELEGVDI